MLSLDEIINYWSSSLMKVKVSGERACLVSHYGDIFSDFPAQNLLDGQVDLRNINIPSSEIEDVADKMLNSIDPENKLEALKEKLKNTDLSEWRRVLKSYNEEHKTNIEIPKEKMAYVDFWREGEFEPMSNREIVAHQTKETILYDWETNDPSFSTLGWTICRDKPVFIFREEGHPTIVLANTVDGQGISMSDGEYEAMMFDGEITEDNKDAILKKVCENDLKGMNASHYEKIAGYRAMLQAGGLLAYHGIDKVFYRDVKAHIKELPTKPWTKKLKELVEPKAPQR